jgi:hypothetical protein
MELNELQKQRLLRAANIAANAMWEGDISGLAFALLRYAGLDIENGYLITSENHVVNNKADIMVEVLVGRQKVLVIECKKDITHPTRSKQQLEGYMQDGQFPHGILMYPLTSTFYSLDVNVNDAAVQKGETYHNITSHEEIINAMSEMRIRNLE